MGDRVPDLRMPLLGAAAWAGGLAGTLVAPHRLLLLAGLTVGAALLALAVLTHRRRRGDGASTRLRGRVLPTAVAALVVSSTVAAVAVVRLQQVEHGPVAALAADRASVTVTLTLTSDPRLSQGGYAPVVVARALVDEVTGRGTTWRAGTPVVVLAPQEWLHVPLGARVRGTALLAPADDGVAALVRMRGDPVPVSPPDAWWQGAEVVRSGIRAAVEDRPDDQRILVPSLVVGDDAGLDPTLAEQFRTTGLTHLLAVSGTNLTLLVGFLLVVARWAGVRGPWTYAVGVVGIVGFVLLARTEPSVVRAATMGSIGLLALTTNGRDRGARALGGAVVVLLLWDPSMSVSAGFALSVTATAGILLLAPDWRDAMAGWMPRWAAEAVAVPAAAQVACTPIVAGISGQVSLVAVVANLLVAPAVAPATVLGLAGGICAVVWQPLGQWIATPAAWSVAWIIAVARWGSGLPTPALEWGTGVLPIALLTGLGVVVVLAAPRLLRSPVWGVGCCTLLLAVVLVRPPTPGWPPRGWVLAACDVGQGDALVLRAGPSSAVVVDAGPDPRALDACLHRLDVRTVPLVVLTHFHADHVDGLPGLMDGRHVGQIDVSPVADPPEGAEQVAEVAARAGLVPQVAPHLQPRQVGDVVLRQVWPVPGQTATPAGDGSTANDSSVVLVAEVRGVRILLTGDVEPPAQRELAGLLAGLRVDVLKVPHHGSRHQDLEFLLGTAPRVALVSVGRDNDYGHPAPDVLRALEGAGARVLRTDVEGDVVLVLDDGHLAVL